MVKIFLLVTNKLVFGLCVEETETTITIDTPLIIYEPTSEIEHKEEIRVIGIADYNSMFDGLTEKTISPTIFNKTHIVTMKDANNSLTSIWETNYKDNKKPQKMNILQ